MFIVWKHMAARGRDCYPLIYCRENEKKKTQSMTDFCFFKQLLPDSSKVMSGKMLGWAPVPDPFQYYLFAV